MTGVPAITRGSTEVPAMRTRLTDLVGCRWPIVQAGMSWASSSAALPLAVSRAGGLGVLAAGPMRLADLRAAIVALRDGTDAPYAVNVPLYRPEVAAVLDLIEELEVPVVIASQGGPRGHVERFHAAGRVWLQVVASVEHARKAEDAGVDGVVAVGVEAGGHPAPTEVTTMVLTRAVVRAVDVAVVASGGVADGAGVVAALALGADGAQLGTRFLCTPEASLHARYKELVLETDIDGTTLLGRGGLPVRVVANQLVRRYQALPAGSDAAAEVAAEATLRQAALDGDVEGGKVEAGQSAGLLTDLVPAGEVVERLVAEMQVAVTRLSALVLPGEAAPAPAAAVAAP